MKFNAVFGTWRGVVTALIFGLALQSPSLSFADKFEFKQGETPQVKEEQLDFVGEVDKPIDLAHFPDLHLDEASMTPLERRILEKLKRGEHPAFEDVTQAWLDTHRRAFNQQHNSFVSDKALKSLIGLSLKSPPPLTQNPFQFKLNYEGQFKENFSHEDTIYNVDHGNPVDWLLQNRGRCESLSDCYSWHARFAWGQFSYRAKKPVMLLLNDHRLPAFILKDQKGVLWLVGVEMTTGGKGFRPIGEFYRLDDSLAAQIIDAEYLFPIAEILAPYIRDSRDAETLEQFCLDRTAEHLHLNIAKLQENVALAKAKAGGRRRGNGRSLFGFGFVVVPVGDQPRANSAPLPSNVSYSTPAKAAPMPPSQSGVKGISTPGAPAPVSPYYGPTRPVGEGAPAPVAAPARVAPAPGVAAPARMFQWAVPGSAFERDLLPVVSMLIETINQGIESRAIREVDGARINSRGIRDYAIAVINSMLAETYPKKISGSVSRKDRIAQVTTWLKDFTNKYYPKQIIEKAISTTAEAIVDEWERAPVPAAPVAPAPALVPVAPPGIPVPAYSKNFDGSVVVAGSLFERDLMAVAEMVKKKENFYSVDAAIGLINNSIGMGYFNRISRSEPHNERVALLSKRLKERYQYSSIDSLTAIANAIVTQWERDESRAAAPSHPNMPAPAANVGLSYTTTPTPAPVPVRREFEGVGSGSLLERDLVSLADRIEANVQVKTRAEAVGIVKDMYRAGNEYGISRSIPRDRRIAHVAEKVKKYTDAFHYKKVSDEARAAAAKAIVDEWERLENKPAPAAPARPYYYKKGPENTPAPAAVPAPGAAPASYGDKSKRAEATTPAPATTTKTPTRYSTRYTGPAAPAVPLFIAVQAGSQFERDLKSVADLMVISEKVNGFEDAVYVVNHIHEMSYYDKISSSIPRDTRIAQVTERLKKSTYQSKLSEKVISATAKAIVDEWERMESASKSLK